MPHDHPLHKTDEDLLYRQELKDRLRKHSDESTITNTISVSALKENGSLNRVPFGSVQIQDKGVLPVEGVACVHAM